MRIDIEDIQEYAVLTLQKALWESDSVCSVSILVIRNGSIEERLETLVDPETKISNYCTETFGIAPWMLQDKPTFPSLWSKICSMLSEKPVITYIAEDSAQYLYQSAARYMIQAPRFDFRCIYYTAKEQFKSCKFKLSLENICDYVGVDSPIDTSASEHSAAIFHVTEAFLKRGCKLVSLNIDPTEISNRFGRPKMLYSRPDGLTFRNKQFVFTGTIPGYTRKALKFRIAYLGGFVVENITETTDYLVVGYQDIDKVNDKDTLKTKKIYTAESLLPLGRIRIIADSDFMREIQRY